MQYSAVMVGKVPSLHVTGCKDVDRLLARHGGDEMNVLSVVAPDVVSANEKLAEMSGHDPECWFAEPAPCTGWRK